MSIAWILGAFLFSTTCSAYKYDPAYSQWNLNQNQTAVDPLDYWGEWSGHTYTPSPSNWRFPFYTLFLDRYVNGDPSNDNVTILSSDKLSRSSTKLALCPYLSQAF